MAKKSLLQEAIAEAKTIRETAIQNAYKALEENLTPSIKEMLANKLEEETEVDLEENEEEQISEDINAGFKKVSPKKTVKEEESEEAPTDEPESEEGEESTEPEETDDVPEEAPEDTPDVEAEADPESEEPSDDTNIADLTLGDLRDLISSIVSQVAPQPAPEGDLGVDMEPGDVEGAGEEEAPLEGDPEMAAEPEGEAPVDPETNEVPSDEEEIDLSELLRELEDEESKDPRGKYHRGGVGNADRENLQEKTEDPGKEDSKFKELSEELDEAYSTINSLKTTLADTNLLNSKLLYTTKLFNENRLSDSQKAHIIKSLDRAKDIREVKLVYNTLSESIVAKAKQTTVVKEHKGSSSKAVGNSTAAPKQVIAESNDWVTRMQTLAGIL